MLLEEKETRLRDFILAQLDNQGFLDRLHSELLKIYANEADIERLDQDDLYNIIVKENIIEKIYPDFWQVNQKFIGSVQTFGELGDGYFLRLEIVEIGHLSLDSEMGFLRAGINLGYNRYLGERRKYKPPKIPVKEAFYLDLCCNSLDKLMKQREPLFVYIISESKSSNHRRIVGIKFVEWRFVLTHNKFSLELDVGHISSRVDQLSKGDFKVKINLSINPKIHNSDLKHLSALEKSLGAEKSNDELRMKQFFEYSKIWWQEYKGINPSFAERVVKIYAEDVFGIYRPISVYVKPLLLRDIECAEIAKRFVSMIPIREKDPLGLDEDKEKWASFSYSLFARQIDKSGQACLLCSLLLGLGIEAYVATGLNGKGVHHWVLTIEDVSSNAANGDKNPKSKSNSQKVNPKTDKINSAIKRVFKYIEPSTGLTLPQKDPRVHNLYRTIGSLFNHDYLYGNLQDKESVR